LYLIFSAFQFFLKVGKFATFSERQKAKSVSASGELRPHDPLTRSSARGSHWGIGPQTPYYRGLTLVVRGPTTL